MRCFILHFSLLLICLSATRAQQRHYFLYRSARYYTLYRDSGQLNAADSLLDHYRAGLQHSMQETLACTDLPLTRAQPESSIGNLVTDALRQHSRRQDTRVIAAVLPYGSLGLDFIAPGPVTRQMIYDLLPYQNETIVLEMNGRLLRRLCDTIAAGKSWPLSGITFIIDNNKATQIRIGDVPLNEHLLYRVASSDYLASQRMFRQTEPGETCKKFPAGFPVSEAVIFYLLQHRTGGKCLHSKPDNRIRYAE